MSLSENLERVRAQIADACARAGRHPDTVALMAVSKTHPAAAIREAYNAGQRLFGENRVQEWQTKLPDVAALFDPASPDAAPDRAQMHLIGPLQNNKTGKAAELFHAVDSIDSLKTAQRLNAHIQATAAAALGRTLPVLLEIKLSHEDSKHGLAPEDLPALLDGLAALQHVRAAGLMTVPPFFEDPEQARPYFAQLCQLRDQHIAAHPSLTQLSMGMSHDFRIAIEEGSTCVRIGTAIFGAREYA